MLDSGTTAIIASASAIGGGAIVAASNYLINRSQARDARRSELRQALVDLNDALAQVELLLRREPRPGRTARAINETMASRLPQLDHTVGQLRRRLLEPHLDAVVASTSKALSGAMVVAPSALIPSIARLTDLMGAADCPTEDWWSEWREARGDLYVRCRDMLGSGALERTSEP